MNDIANMREIMQQLDADRIRITKELEKRRHDLRMHAAKMQDSLIRAEKMKISQLEDVLEDVQYDLDAIVEDIFRNDASAPELFSTLLDDFVDPEEDQADLEEQYRKAEQDLQQYKLREKELKTELLDLQNVIEETEDELQDLCARLVKV